MCGTMNTMRNSAKLHRYISIFNKSNDLLVSTVSLTSEEFEKIRLILGYSDNDPMYECYPVIGEAFEQVSALLAGRLTRGNFDYFLDTDSE